MSPSADLDLWQTRARECLDRWEPEAARAAAEQARAIAAGWGDAAGVAVADVLLARAALLTSSAPTSALLPGSVRRCRAQSENLSAAVSRFEVELAAARGEPSALPVLDALDAPTADSPVDLVAAHALALMMRPPDAAPVARSAGDERVAGGSATEGWWQLVGAVRAGARNDDGPVAAAAVARWAEARGNRALLWAALSLQASVSAKQGRQDEARTARRRMVDLLDAWAATLPEGPATEASRRPDRVALRAAAAESTGVDVAFQLVELGIALGQERDVARLIDLALDAAVAVTGARRGVLLLVGQGPDYRVAATRSVDDGPEGQHLLGLSSTIARRALAERSVVASEDVRRDPRFSECASISIDVTGVLCAPIFARAELEGAIYLDRRARGRAFDTQAIAAARAIGAMLATALLTARVIADLERNGRDLEAARAELALALQKRTVERDDVTRRLATVEDVVPAGPSGTGIVGRAPAMLRMHRAIQNVAASDVPVLVAGETGSGKELVARALHAASQRRDGPFVGVNCGALSETLLAAELFGAERGAYTGAATARPGLFVAAHGGTLFLDEVGDMAPAMQTSLLRVLETSEIRPVGSTATRKVDVRIVAASHRDLVELVGKGTFRDDLRYRLEVVRIEVPPLRERLEDLPELCEYLLREVRRRYTLPDRRLAAETIAALARRRWPGNVRELRHVLASAALNAAGPIISPSDLPAERAAGPAAKAVAVEAGPEPGSDGHAIRAESIRRSLKATAGHRGRAAQLLGISRSTLYRYIEAYAIDAGEFDLPSSQHQRGADVDSDPDLT